MGTSGTVAEGMVLTGVMAGTRRENRNSKGRAGLGKFKED